jgi:hypothetical protein
MDSQPRVDDGVLIAAHGAGADLMMVSDNGFPDVVAGEARRRSHGCRVELASAPAVAQGRLDADGPAQFHGGDQSVDVLRGAEHAGVDQRRAAGIGGGDPHRAAAGWADEAGHEGDAVCRCGHPRGDERDGEVDGLQIGYGKSGPASPEQVTLAGRQPGRQGHRADSAEHDRDEPMVLKVAAHPAQRGSDIDVEGAQQRRVANAGALQDRG